MFERIIRLAIEHRWLVILAVLGMAVLGIYNYQRLPIDAVPDITNVQVQINTAAPGYSPLELSLIHISPTSGRRRKMCRR